MNKNNLSIRMARRMDGAANQERLRRELCASLERLSMAAAKASETMADTAQKIKDIKWPAGLTFIKESID